MFQGVLTAIQAHYFLTLLAVISSYLLFNRYGRGLNRYPGPLLGSFTSVWRVWDVWATAHLPPFVHLHKQYGDVVRLKPNCLAFAQPEAIRDIYGPGGVTQKSDLHRVAQQTSRGVAFPTLFSNLNKEWHDRVRRCVNFAFSMTTLVQYEAYIDDTIRVFLEQMEKRVATAAEDKTTDFVEFLHFYTDDAITCVTYGERIGHMESGQDVGGILASTMATSVHHILVSQWPVFDLWTRKNPIYLWLQKTGHFNPHPSKAVAFAMEHQQRRRVLRKEKKGTNETEAQTLTDKFLIAQEDHPEIMSNNEVLAMALAIINAGSDTTAISLAAMFYYLLKSPDSLRKLCEEVDEAFNTGPSTPIGDYRTIKFARAQQLPYLDACIKEAFRMHPATRWFPERVVGPGGHLICGEHIPEGTVVGVSAWIIHRNASIFGEDVDSFKPERWLIKDPGKLHEMERMLQHFGHGNYTCIGKNIALLEMYKLAPALLRYFDLSFADPNKEWRLVLGTFVNVTDFNVRLKKRQIART